MPTLPLLSNSLRSKLVSGCALLVLTTGCSEKEDTPPAADRVGAAVLKCAEAVREKLPKVPIQTVPGSIKPREVEGGYEVRGLITQNGERSAFTCKVKVAKGAGAAPEVTEATVTPT